jgi:RNA polymerase sigma-70 factor (ECF subfamily)
VEEHLPEPDADLIRRVQAGDPEAFERLVHQHGSTLRAHLGRYVGHQSAEDLLQEVWLRVWQRAGQWNGRGSVIGWLLAIGTNLALNALRARRRTASIDALMESEEWDTVASASEAVAPEPEDEVIWRDQLARTVALIENMPADRQAVVRMARIEGRPLHEIAAALGVPLGTVKSRLHHAMRWLNEQMEETE